MFAAALKGIKTRTINVLLSTSPIFLSTGEIKSKPASSKEKTVKKKLKIRTHFILKKYEIFRLNFMQRSR